MPWLPYHHDWKLAFQISLGLRVHWFGRYAGYPEWEIPPARLRADMLNFFFVERNSCWVIINGRKLTLHAGDLLIVSGADAFCYGHNPEEPHVSVSACLALEQGSIANTLLSRKLERKYSWRSPAEFSAEFDKVLQAMASTSHYRDFEIAGAILQWLAYVMSRLGAPLDQAFAAERNVVDKVLTAESWANTRLKENIRLVQWAKAVGLHPVYFGRIFKRETGLRPMEWLNQRRLEMAGQYLSSTRKSVAEIADLCGFSNQFYFSRVFRRHFGKPPSQYRKAHF